MHMGMSLHLPVQAHADRLEGGAQNPLCKELARLYSIAVDYPKTGEPANLRKENWPEMYPDFMQHQGRFREFDATSLGS